MIATTHRMATQDSLLIAIAVIVISLSFLPKGDARQTLVIRDPSGNVQTYSFKANDPRLASLGRKMATWSRQKPNSALAIQKWCAEVADYYALRTEPKADQRQNVVPVSFTRERPDPIDTSEAKELSAQHALWVRFAAEARKSIAKTQLAIERRQQLAGPPPIELGDVASGHHSPRMLVLAGVFGLCVASGFAWWTYVCPKIRLRSPRTSPGPAHHTEDRIGGLQLEIPSEWVRVRQPVGVVIRQIAYSIVMVAGAVCAIL